MTLSMACALAWIVGLWLAAQMALSSWAWLPLALGASAGRLALRRWPVWRWPLAAICCLGLGGARYRALAALPSLECRQHGAGGRTWQVSLERRQGKATRGTAAVRAFAAKSKAKQPDVTAPVLVEQIWEWNGFPRAPM